MSLRGIDENTTTARLSDSNNRASSIKFVSSPQAANDVQAIKFITEQFASQTISPAQPQQDNLQQEAQQLVEKHTSQGWFGFSWLDNDALGKELAATIGERPELAKAVFGQLGKTEIYTAQAMIDNASDEQLVQAAKSETGKQLLSQTKQAFSDNIAYQKSWGEWFASKEKVAMDEQRINRIDTALAKSSVAEVQKETATNSNVQPREIPAAELPAGGNPEIRWELPESGTGYVTYNRNDSRLGVNAPLEFRNLAKAGKVKIYDQVGTKETVERMQALASKWNTLHPDRLLQFGDMSLQGGVDTKDHAGHQKGNIFDMRPLRNDDKTGVGANLNYNSQAYDREMTKDFIRLTLRMYPGAVIRFNDPKIANDPEFKGKIITDKPGGHVHDDHLHIELP